MKQNIHPNYGPSSIQCACGNVIETRGTKERISVEICSACHPFFTGRQKLMDTAGRIDRFKKKFGDKVASSPVKKAKAKAAPAKKEPKIMVGSSVRDKFQKAKDQASSKQQK